MSFEFLMCINYNQAMANKRRSRVPFIYALGVMTGTSCDGLDAACVSIDSEGWEPCWAQSAPYPPRLRKQVLAAQAPGARLALKEVLALQRDLGEWYGTVIRRLISRHPEKPDVIANHGQTIAHYPSKNRKAREGMTFQVGDPTRVAYLTGLTTIGLFRDGDMSAGGEGAPLVPWFHRLLASHLAEGDGGLAIHNIGGISNLTYIPQPLGGARTSAGDLIAFDTGPGNIWIDAAASLATRGRLKFDRGGKIALEGEVDWKAIEKILKNPYFKLPPPKSTGRDDFPFELLQRATRARGPDLVATATALTIESIGQAYERFVLGKSHKLSAIHVAGGGARNPVLMSWLASRMAPSGVRVSPLGDSGLDGKWIEAQAFAFFGLLSLLGEPIGGSWTGVNHFAPPGHIIPGKNWASLLSKLRAINPESFKANSSR